MDHFIVTTTILTIKKTTTLFINHAYKLHCIFFELIRGSDARFLGRFWQELHYLLDTPLPMSTSFQTDDRT
jgi:hypothetical protein